MLAMRHNVVPGKNGNLQSLVRSIKNIRDLVVFCFLPNMWAKWMKNAGMNVPEVSFMRIACCFVNGR